MIKKILVFLLLQPCFVLFGQSTEEIINLEKQLEQTSGKERMLILEQLATFYSDSLSEVAIGYNTQYLKLAELYESPVDEARAYSIFGSIYLYQVDYDNALKSNLEAIKVYSQLGDSLNIFVHYYRAGNNYLFLHKPDSALIFTRKSCEYFNRKNLHQKLLAARILEGKILTRSNQYRKAVEKFKSILAGISDSTQYHTMAWAQYWLAQSEMNMGDFTSAIRHLKMSIKNYERTGIIHGKLGSMQLLGKLYQIIGNNAQAYELFFESYKNRDHVKGDLGREHFLAQYEMNMGNIFLNTDEFDKALQRYDSSFAIANRHEFNDILADLFIAKGRVLFRQKEYDKALESFQQAYAIYQNRGHTYGIARVLNNIGSVYQLRKEYKTAIGYYNQAHVINMEIGNRFGEAQNHKNIATCLMHQGKYNLARRELDNGIEHALFSAVDNLVLKYYRNYIDLYELNGDLVNAQIYSRKYLDLSEKQQYESSRNMTQLLLGIYENELQAKTELLQQKLAIQELENEKNNLQIKQMLGFGGLILSILILITFLYANKIRTTRKLELQVAERTRTLKESEQKLIEINQTKDKFYSIIAHDLKSPFNSLIGFSNLLHDEYPDFSDAERLNFIEIIRTSSEEIYELLENLLDWTRNSSNDIHFKQIRIDLARVTKQILLLQEKNAEMKNISVVNKVPKNTFAIADENMIRTVIRNLLSNAIKFTGEHGEITLETRQYDSTVEYVVNDTGIGISPENLEKIFKIESKLRKKGTANERGTGLGLMLCKDFVTKNGGELRAESEPGKGSTFSFTLPAKKHYDEKA